MKDNGQQSSFTDIDLDRLDEAWCAQPGLYHRYAVQLADAKRKHAEAKASLDVVEAETALKIRKAPEAFLGDVKPTEASIAACVTTQKIVRKALAVVIEAKHACDVLEAAVWALDHKKKGLENMVQLHSMNYFSAPRTPANVSRESVETLENNARRNRLKRQQAERGK